MGDMIWNRKKSSGSATLVFSLFSARAASKHPFRAQERKLDSVFLLSIFFYFQPLLHMGCHQAMA
jgi:hypothetical protein